MNHGENLLNIYSTYSQLNDPPDISKPSSKYALSVPNAHSKYSFAKIFRLSYCNALYPTIPSVLSHKFVSWSANCNIPKHLYNIIICKPSDIISN